MIARNRELARTLALWLALAIGAALAGNALAGLRGAALGIGAAMATAVPFLILTYRRYRALRTMAGNLDAVLHGERELSFDRMDEGELAVLASELDKMVLRLTLTADDLAAERTRLADALADISHQLKTPLTALSLTTELVRKDLSADGARPQTVERLRQIEALEMRVEDLVSTLLRLAQLDAGALAFAREPWRSPRSPSAPPRLSPSPSTSPMWSSCKTSRTERAFRATRRGRPRPSATSSRTASSTPPRADA